tara:strand:- start:17412 stop:18371 length:960 start_codon:yes stop_codon:yes gene_type:complete
MLVAITGANGFVGNYLSNYLENKNIDVRRIQRKKSTNAFIIEDINSNNVDWSSALKDVDVLVHCAAKVHIFDDQNQDIINSYYSINVNATKNLAYQAALCGVKRFIFISTIKVFGEETELNNPFSLNSDNNPQDHYAISKLKSEMALQELTSNSDLELIIIRPPLIYGPNVGANFLKLMSYVYKKYPIPFGGINNKRSILYIGNLVDLIYRCINDKKAVGKTLLVSDLKPLSIAELTQKIAYSLNTKPLIISIPNWVLNFVNNLLLRRVNLKKLTSSLEVDSSESNQSINWIPPFSTDQGLLDTANWFKNKQINSQKFK